MISAYSALNNAQFERFQIVNFWLGFIFFRNFQSISVLRHLIQISANFAQKLAAKLSRSILSRDNDIVLNLRESFCGFYLS